MDSTTASQTSVTFPSLLTLWHVPYGEKSLITLLIACDALPEYLKPFGFEADFNRRNANDQKVFTCYGKKETILEVVKAVVNNNYFPDYHGDHDLLERASYQLRQDHISIYNLFRDCNIVCEALPEVEEGLDHVTASLRAQSIFHFAHAQSIEGYQQDMFRQVLIDQGADQVYSFEELNQIVNEAMAESPDYLVSTQAAIAKFLAS
ncbi:MAG: hypothetical protein ACRCXZ_04595 [Patescibacteria group bacterium]